MLVIWDAIAAIVTSLFWWWNLVDIGSSNGLLPDGTKPWPKPMLINLELSSTKSSGIHSKVMFPWIIIQDIYPCVVF